MDSSGHQSQQREGPNFHRMSMTSHGRPENQQQRQAPAAMATTQENKNQSSYTTRTKAEKKKLLLRSIELLHHHQKVTDHANLPKCYLRESILSACRPLMGGKLDTSCTALHCTPMQKTLVKGHVHEPSISPSHSPAQSGWPGDSCLARITGCKLLFGSCVPCSPSQAPRNAR